MENTCKFYKLDLEAKAEAESMEALFHPSFPEDESAASGHMEIPPEENDPFSTCGAFCRYLTSGNGYPGEHVYYCCAAGNEHIIHVDFNESEII